MIEAVVYIVMCLVTALLLNQIMLRVDGESLSRDLIPLQVIAGCLWPATLPLTLMCLAVYCISIKINK